MGLEAVFLFLPQTVVDLVAQKPTDGWFLETTPKICSICMQCLPNCVGHAQWSTVISAHRRHGDTLILCNCHEHATAKILSPEACFGFAPPRATDLCMFDGTPNYGWG